MKNKKDKIMILLHLNMYQRCNLCLKIINSQLICPLVYNMIRTMHKITFLNNSSKNNNNHHPNNNFNQCHNHYKKNIM